MNKDKFHIQAYNNILFAGWIKEITIPDTNLTLPPLCILFEGYGETKSRIISLKYPSGFKQNFEFNALSAFVTYYHPSSKYAESGTDGTLAKELTCISSCFE